MDNKNYNTSEEELYNSWEKGVKIHPFVLFMNSKGQSSSLYFISPKENGTRLSNNEFHVWEWINKSVVWHVVISQILTWNFVWLIFTIELWAVDKGDCWKMFV